MDERFRKAEEEYFILRGKLDTGRIGKNLFELALRDSMVQDAQNRWWMLGPDTGNWYMHDGTKWVEADPSHVQVATEITSTAPKSTPGRSSDAGDSPNRTPLFVGLGCAAIVCLAIVVGGIYFSNQALRAASSANSTLIALGTPIVPVTTPTSSSGPIATPSPSPSATDTTTPTFTRVIPPRPSNTPTSLFPSGVYVTGIRIDPPQPKRKFDVTFYPTFLNTTGALQNHRIVTYIYRPDQIGGRSMGETPPTNTIAIAPGTSELATLAWVLTGPGGCEDFIVRVAWWDDLKNPTFFNLPNGQPFQVPITVCP